MSGVYLMHTSKDLPYNQRLVTLYHAIIEAVYSTFVAIDFLNLIVTKSIYIDGMVFANYNNLFFLTVLSMQSKLAIFCMTFDRFLDVSLNIDIVLPRLIKILASFWFLSLYLLQVS